MPIDFDDRVVLHRVAWMGLVTFSTGWQGMLGCQQADRDAKDPLPFSGGFRRRRYRTALISHEVFLKSFCKRQFPHKSVNQSLIMTNIKNKLTDLCGSWLLQNDFINTFCETNSEIR